MSVVIPTSSNAQFTSALLDKNDSTIPEQADANSSSSDSNFAELDRVEESLDDVDKLKQAVSARDQQISYLKEQLKSQQAAEDTKLAKARAEIKELYDMMQSVHQQKEQAEKERNDLRSMIKMNEQALTEMS